MTKKDLEDIIQTAKAAGANVKVVQVGSAENEPVERPKIPHPPPVSTHSRWRG